VTFHRTDAALGLLNDVERYCARTRTPEQSIGHVLFRHPGFVGLLRLRLQLTEEKEAASSRICSLNGRGGMGVTLASLASVRMISRRFASTVTHARAAAFVGTAAATTRAHLSG
jgi:hypothetical protein